MKRHLTVTLAALVVGGGFALLSGPATRAEDKPDQSAKAADQSDQSARSAGAADKPARVTFPAGVKLKDDPNKADHGAILKPLATLTEAVLTKNGFDDALERLVDQDRNRIGKEGAAERKYDDLNGRVDSLRKAWKAKYGKDFKIDTDKAFAQVATLAGEVENPQAVAGGWPVPPVSPAAGEAVTAGAKQSGGTNANADSNIEKGRDIAIATFPEARAGKQPALNVSLIQELGGWRIDVPNTTTGQQLHDNLLKHLNHLADMQSQWPVEPEVAELVFARHVLMAVYGVDLQGEKRPGSEGGAAPSDEPRQNQK